MKRLLLLVMLAGVMTACGTDTGGNTTVQTRGTTTSTTTTSTTLPGGPQRELFDAARAQWTANRPDAYYLRYVMLCECIPGPFEVYVDENGTFSAVDVTDPQSDYVPFLSVADIFDDILATLDGGEVPVEVQYDPEFGLPVVYSYNPPGQAYDAGFVMRVETFDPDETAGAGERVEARRLLEEAQARWSAARLTNYQYTFSRICFCPEEYLGPYQVTVVQGEIASALFEGEEILERIGVDSYTGLIETPDSIFARLRQALGSPQTGEVTARYHPEFGYPTDASIDWIEFAADDEVGYTISDLKPSSYPNTCSAASLNVDLVDQPGLPERVARTRQAIYDAAINCNFAGLIALAEASPYFTASFGGSRPGEYWVDLEEQGIPVIADMILHLNLPHTNEEETFLWPNAFVNLLAADGTGIPPEEYQALLAIYTVDELEEMFETIGGYVGWRHGILASGDWIFFVAGD